LNSLFLGSLPRSWIGLGAFLCGQVLLWITVPSLALLGAFLPHCLLHLSLLPHTQQHTAHGSLYIHILPDLPFLDTLDWIPSPHLVLLTFTCLLPGLGFPFGLVHSYIHHLVPSSRSGTCLVRSLGFVLLALILPLPLPWHLHVTVGFPTLAPWVPHLHTTTQVPSSPGWIHHTLLGSVSSPVVHRVWFSTHTFHHPSLGSTYHSYFFPSSFGPSPPPHHYLPTTHTHTLQFGCPTTVYFLFSSRVLQILPPGFPTQFPQVPHWLVPFTYHVWFLPLPTFPSSSSCCGPGCLGPWF